MTTLHKWKFFRAGGFDQVQLDTGADLQSLPELDQKLWVALSCPTQGIEFDPKTLKMIDNDGDGHIRANEILTAVKLSCTILKNAEMLIAGSDHLALSDIDDSNEEGRQILASARHILESLGKPDEAEITLGDMDDIEKLIAGLVFNGDGVICPANITDAGLRTTVEDIAKCTGTVTDKGGEAGINQEVADRFFSEADAYSAWYAKGEGDSTVLILGDQTLSAAAAFHAIRDKVEDYFTRCQLAAYDTRAAAPLSRAVEDYQQIAAHILSGKSDEVGSFPLATVSAGKPLPLLDSVNPAWQQRMASFHKQVILPLLGEKVSLTITEWAELRARFAEFEAWQAVKPQTNVEPLGITRLREILAGNHKAAIDELMLKDKAVESEVKSIRLVETLLHYNRDLFKLVNNFVSFRSFYTGREKAVFQLGTLYMDGRSCDLCVKVDDVNKHAGFASMSSVCLAYCECVRTGGTEKMNIAAAFTAGDSDFLMVGRNGIFYDRKGLDWNVKIVRVVDHPISIRQAFWSPYKKLIKMISDQLQKFASTKASAVEGSMLKATTEGTKPIVDAAASATPAKTPFDVAKFAGIFAAIGLAIGAIGGILASIVSGLLGLEFWQIPLAIIGLMLLISCPSMALAWFKLKQRSLGPILDASGWAINARVFINIPFGTSLTGMAGLPPGSSRSLVDPFAEKKSMWPYYLAIVVTIALLVALWDRGFFG